jgi:dipeptidyl aminopeptidase/acylaminoacyl peptidase
MLKPATGTCLRVTLALFIALTAAAPAIVAAQPPFTVEQIMSAPFPTSLVAAPTGARVAWVFDERGARNIWVAEGPAFAGRRLTDYTGDNGQELTSLAWTPDGRAIVYVRGGGPNRAGELPNPTSEAAGVEQSVWVVPVSGGGPRRLGNGSGPAISPKGDLVAFVERGQIWIAGVSGAPAAAQLLRARGTARSLRWSPDGTKIAFVSGRGTHAYIGVFDVAARAVRFLDPSFDSDSEPAWSIDSRQVAFIRQPARRDRLPFHPEREGQPWSIRIAEVSSGAGREVWRAEPGYGSLFQGITGSAQLVWTADDRLVFPWERTGWKLLYAVPATGGAASLLTPGAFEVEDVAPAPDGRTLIYNSNQDDIDRRHIWRVAAAGGAAPQPLTSGRGIEWSAALLPDNETLAFLQSDARRPAQPMIQAAGAAPRELAPGSVPVDFPLAALVEPEAVAVVAADGMRVPAQLFRPASARPGDRLPAVAFFHGGSRRQMLLGWHYMGYYHNTYAFNQYLASQGYVVLSVNFRSGTGYGLEFREALDYGANGASEYNDVSGAALYLRSRDDVDPARVGLWGGSYGGFLTAMGLARGSDLFAAGVDVHGVHDWNVVIRNFQPGYNPEARAEIARRAFQSSPMYYVDGWRSPVLLIHGDDDRNVPFSESVDLIEQLRARNVTVEQLVFPDEVHGFLLHERWVRAFRLAFDFFERHLRGREATSQ